MRIKNNKKIICLILLNSLLLFLTIPVGAAFTNPVSSGYNLELKLDPKYPSANQTVSAQVELYGLAIEKNEILWFIDGILIEQGIGQKEFFFQTGNWGENTILTVQINTSNDGQMQKQINIFPTEVNLIWETGTYTPPFYKGKALNSSNSIINIVAFPNFVDRNGEKIDSKKLIYEWKENWEVKGSKSGYGKNTFSTEGPQINQSKDITVEVKSIDGTMIAKKTISTRAENPKIVFYRQDPLLGTLYNKGITGSYNLKSEELKVKASPFFFSPQSEINYKWTMNGQIMSIYNNEINLRRPEDQIGSSQVSLKIQNMDKILQFADNNFLIKYDN